jgi:hypothetical protein
MNHEHTVPKPRFPRLVGQAPEAAEGPRGEAFGQARLKAAQTPDTDAALLGEETLGSAGTLARLQPCPTWGK